MLNITALIRVVVIIVVVAFMASQGTGITTARATGVGTGDPHDDCCDEILSKLDQIIEGNDTDCDVCPPPEGIMKSWVPKGQGRPHPFL